MDRDDGRRKAPAPGGGYKIVQIGESDLKIGHYRMRMGGAKRPLG